MRLLVFILLTLAATVQLAQSQSLAWAYMPEAAGLVRVNHQLYIDDPSKADKAMRFIRGAERDNRRFFGRLISKPKYIVCTRKRCSDRFGLRPTAVTIGYQRIIIGHTGMLQEVFTHERLHTEINRAVGFVGMARGSVPMWFNEGLASFVADNSLGKTKGRAKQSQWVKAARTPNDWNAMLRKRGFTKTYRAAKAVVEGIAKQVGREHLARFARGLNAGSDFDAELSALLSRGA